MEVILTPKAKKQYKALPKPEQQKIKKKLYLLERSPYGGKKLSGELFGSYSVKAWPYRIIYLINPSQKKIFVETVAHRQGVYD